MGRTCTFPTCVSVPQPDKAPFFNIPRSASITTNDTLCKAVRAMGETERCLDITTSCNDLADSPFSSSLSVCSSTPSSDDYQMCFRNITRGMNGTRIHFFYSISPPCDITGARVTYWQYIDSYEITIQGKFHKHYPGRHKNKQNSVTCNCRFLRRGQCVNQHYNGRAVRHISA